jgi:transcriptional regulator with XRE-family HTH domain
MNHRYLIIFGRNIRYIRRQRGYNQRQFAILVKMDRNKLGKIERGERKLIAISTIILIAKSLGIEPGELFRGCE